MKSNQFSKWVKAIEINPRADKAYHNRGHAYWKKDQFDKAISDYTKAIELNPRLAEAYNNRGVAYFFKKEYEKAWDDVHKVQNLGYTVHPEFVRALRQASGRQK
jgi:tetratricopeptide (TPR) repeat protein